jgi:hypothetical protein
MDNRLSAYALMALRGEPGRRNLRVLSSRILVAGTPVRDLFDHAKHLLVSAMFRRQGAQTAEAVASYDLHLSHQEARHEPARRLKELR